VPRLSLGAGRRTSGAGSAPRGVLAQGAPSHSQRERVRLAEAAPELLSLPEVQPEKERFTCQGHNRAVPHSGQIVAGAATRVVPSPAVAGWWPPVARHKRAAG
jgi:hypothetical protein